MKTRLGYLLIIGLLSACQSKTKTSASLNETTVESTQQNSLLSESIKRGSKIYAAFCVTCHLPNGKGVPKAFPPLANSDYLMNNRAKSIKAIKYGQSGAITVNGTTYNGTMAPLGLKDQEVADVMNYITNSWGNSNKQLITEEEVSKIEP